MYNAFDPAFGLGLSPWGRGWGWSALRGLPTAHTPTLQLLSKHVEHALPAQLELNTLSIISLLPAALCLAGLAWWLCTANARVALPKADTEAERGASAVDDADVEHTSPPPGVDALDDEAIFAGKPINVAQWQRTLRRSLRAQAVLALLLMGLDVVQIARGASAGAWLSAADATPYACDGLTWLTVALLAAAPALEGSVTLREVAIFVLSSLAVTLQLARLLLQPSSQTQGLAAPYAGAALQVTSLLLGIACWIVAATTPLGPRRRYLDAQGKEDVREVYPASLGGASSILDHLFFCQGNKVLEKAKRRGRFEHEDAHGPARYWRCKYISSSILSLYNAFAARHPQRGPAGTVTSTSPRLVLLQTILAQNWREFLLIAFLSATSAVVQFLPIVSTRGLLASLEGQAGSTASERITATGPWCFALLGSSVLASTASSYMLYYSILCVYTRFETQLNCLLFAKSLRRKDVTSGSDSKSSGGQDGDGDGSDSDDAPPPPQEGFAYKGQIVTLSTTDVPRVAMLAMYLNDVVETPAQVLVGGFFAYQLLGTSALWGIFASLAVMPLMLISTRLQGSAQQKVQTCRDKRTTVLSEAFSSVRTLKFNAWEQRVQERVHDVRKRELRGIAQSIAANISMTVLMVISTLTLTLVAFGHYTLVRQQTLTPSVAFTALKVLGDLKYSVCNLPYLVVAWLQASVSFRRIATYLQSEEVVAAEAEGGALAGNEEHIVLVDATITWPAAPSVVSSRTRSPRPLFTLRDINASFEPGRLNILAGRLGTGKTLLLRALLGEAELLSGSITCPRSSPAAIAADRSRVPRPFAASTWVQRGRVAYVPQTAFLQSATIRDNILFGAEMWEQRYESVLFACGLKPDLQVWQDGDMTEVGDNGILLSGGQKARISLARAIYSRASLLLLDDVLSAVDAGTAEHIYKHLFAGDLCQGRTIVLASHQLQLATPMAAKAIVLANETVEFAGSAADFVKSEWYAELLTQGAGQGTAQKEAVDAEAPLVRLADDAVGTATKDADETAPANACQNGEDSASATPAQSAPSKPTTTTIVKEEKRATGSVSLSVYKRWFTESGGLWLWVPALLVYLADAGLDRLEPYWLKLWSEDASLRPAAWWLLWFGAIGFASALAVGLREAAISWGTLRAGRRLFQGMLAAVLAAPMSFHDGCPQGRLLNRFGADMQSVDEQVAWYLQPVMAGFLQAAVTLMAISLGGGPLFLVAFALISPVYYFYYRVFTLIQRDSKRLSSTKRSQMLTAVTEAISGAVVLRAFGAASSHLDAFYALVDDYTAVRMPSSLLTRWLGQRSNLIGTGLVVATSALIVVNPGAQWGYDVSAAMAGFILSSMADVHTSVYHALNYVAWLETSLVAVERVVEYCSLPSEGARIVHPRPPADWPSRGAVEIRGLSARYAPDLPLVLDDVHLSIAPGEKVAIVGATGSGKSTLAASFFRFLEPERGGAITIDGLDIAGVGLEDLRGRVRIVPQDPSILSGRLRDAVDVFGEYSDDEVRGALRAVSLIEGGEREPEVGDVGASTRTPAPTPTPAQTAPTFTDLSLHISESGTNLSAGQRQLLCLARAILTRARLILFDEATSSTDPVTERILGSTVRRVFRRSTVLAIAHRLRSVIDFDRVVVLEGGRVVEVGRPAELLKREGGRFRGLCSAAGAGEYEYLVQAAAAAAAAAAAGAHGQAVPP